MGWEESVVYASHFARSSRKMRAEDSVMEKHCWEGPKSLPPHPFRYEPISKEGNRHI